ncbi:MAG: cyclase family protein [Candidatus Omnitrophica bacterium]|nr:cyclase family protein [Candidatus Omnitrophota bacterium]
MVRWPGDPKIKIKQIHSIAKGATANVSHISMGSHTGTHMDAPFHFFPKGEGIDAIPLDAAVGKARVIEIHDRESIKADELKGHNIRSGERILFKTINSRRCWKTEHFVKDFVYVSAEAAKFLAARKIKSLGVDYLSVGGYLKDGEATHRALLKAGIWIIEGLNLSKARPGEYELVCLPLKLLHGDGAPARVIVRPWTNGK